jgi:ribosome biogenesis GTPase
MTKHNAVQGQVVRIVSNRYTVEAEGKTYIAYARGRLRLGEDIFVGDNVVLEIQKPLSVIEEILPRKNKMIRPYVANIDSVILIVAKEPEPDWILVDKILLNCFKEGIEPILCYNKCDLAEKAETEILLAPYQKIVKCLTVSGLRGDNLSELGSLVKGKLVCFAGQSAVGKTSILNALSGLSLKTDGLSARIMRGKNTTRHVEIFNVCGGRVADTCGFSMLESIEVEYTELMYYYPEFVPLQSACRYKSCTHIAEPDCAVKEALKKGLIDSGRYARYTEIYRELKKAREERYE